jgi:hypothetical protein
VDHLVYLLKSHGPGSATAHKGWALAQAICDSPDDRTGFGYQHVSATKTVWDAHTERRAEISSDHAVPRHDHPRARLHWLFGSGCCLGRRSFDLEVDHGLFAPIARDLQRLEPPASRQLSDAHRL